MGLGTFLLKQLSCFCFVSGNLVLISVYYYIVTPFQLCATKWALRAFQEGSFIFQSNCAERHSFFFIKLWTEQSRSTVRAHKVLWAIRALGAAETAKFFPLLLLVQFLEATYTTSPFQQTARISLPEASALLGQLFD